MDGRDCASFAPLILEGRASFGSRIGITGVKRAERKMRRNPFARPAAGHFSKCLHPRSNLPNGNFEGIPALFCPLVVSKAQNFVFCRILSHHGPYLPIDLMQF